MRIALLVTLQEREQRRKRRVLPPGTVWRSRARRMRSVVWAFRGESPASIRR